MAASSAVKLPPNFDIEAKNAAAEWTFWKQEFEDYLVCTGRHESDDQVKLSLLRNMMGHASARRVAQIPMTDAEKKKYDSTIAAIEKYLKPRDTVVFDRHMWLLRVQEEGENFEHFLSDCRELLAACKYDEKDPEEPLIDQFLRDKIVHGIREPSTRQKLLGTEKLTLGKAENLCRSVEQSCSQAEFFNPPLVVDAVKKFQRRSRDKPEDKPVKVDIPAGKFSCRRCATIHGKKECPAYGKPCERCGILNHVKECCRRTLTVNKVTVKTTDSDSEELLFSDRVELIDTCALQEVESPSEDIFKILSAALSRAEKSEWYETILVDNQPLYFKLDPGSDVTIIPLHIFKTLSAEYKPIMSHSKLQLEGFEGLRCRPLYAINSKLKYGDLEISDTVFIIEAPTLSKSLLGKPACLKLKLVQRTYGVYHVTSVSPSCKENFIQLNSDVFKGVGRFPDVCGIPTKEITHQICHPPTRVVDCLRTTLKVELDRLETRKAIAKVDVIDPRACVSRMIMVEKPNKKVRICLDPSDLNTFVVRKPKEIPTVEDIATKLRGKNFFSVFDLTEGFHHIVLDEESSWKCCFATVHGVYRYLVLPFGLLMAPELFQDQVEKYFGDIPNVIIMFDDLLVAGATEAEHDKAVSDLLTRAREKGAIFNKDKLQG
ncbi:uncharacterized protein LOC113214768 [Frankliniella occidentalis]|uniref:Uncharacterized protein LOC113214768 n=1 Tax=Frankliniella occidentalis TaxID=133901 RepID=A0A6J1TB25_FRAOC|nr:uncharacterized protein LOC113214768 [Frankliniella occidentalis]